MAYLTARQRARLPDRAFAYIDPQGRRRLPIHDAAHLRNALARFNQVVFEDEAARDRARRKLLTAARRHGIVPIGFITGQLRSQGKRALPDGQVTFLLADIEGSTALLRRLEEGYAGLLADVRRLLRGAVRRQAGSEVDVHGDEFFAVFKRAPDALLAALAIQRQLRDGRWPDGLDVRVRIGIHSGRPTLTDHGYVGLAVHAVARISGAAHGGQIVLSAATVRVLGETPAGAFRLVDLGAHRLAGLPEPERLYQVITGDLSAGFPPLRTSPG